MIKAKKKTLKSRNLEKALKHVKEEKQKQFYVDIPESEFWKIKMYVLKHRMTLREWLRDKIGEIRG